MRIFVSYSHHDGLIATGLSNLLQSAFGPVLAEVFLDRSSIAYGTNITTSVIDALRRADVLIAVAMGAQPSSVLSWPGFEIGRFSAFWEDAHYKQGPHSSREKHGVIGRVVVLSNGRVPLGPEEGQRMVNLGIPESFLSEARNEEELINLRMAASVGNSELLDFLRTIEQEFKDEESYTRFKEKVRIKSLEELVKDFKAGAFDVLRGRVRSTSKPTKQLVVLSKGGASSLKSDTKLFSVAGAAEIFGKNEGDTRLFKASDGTAGSTRYEAAWGEFCASVKNHPYGAYWCGVIEHAVISAIKGGAEFDAHLVLISDKDERYQIVATTITTFFNNDAEVSLYLIEALKRPSRGDVETSKLLDFLIIICRFRFAFLERSSPYYWRNFRRSRMNAKDLLMELDYLRSEAAHANLEKEGVFEEYLNDKDLNEMMRIWHEVDGKLRGICDAAIAAQLEIDVSSEISERIVEQLKRIYDEVKPFNAMLGATVSQRLLDIFSKDESRSPAKL